MEQNVNRLVVFVFNNGYRTMKNTRDANALVLSGQGYIEGQEPKQKQEAPKEVIVKQTKKKKQ